PPLPPVFPYTTLFRSLSPLRCKLCYDLIFHVQDVGARGAFGRNLVDCQSRDAVVYRQARRATRRDFSGLRPRSIKIFDSNHAARSEEHTSELQSLAYL